MPRLRVINNVDVKYTDMALRQRYKRVNQLINKLPMFANHYQIGVLQAPVWYIQDEVGSAIQHSDQPNVKCFPFMYSPNNSISDPNALSFNVLWPTKDISVNDAIYRDFLTGFTEDQFRSARLHTWFETPEHFYAKALTKLNNKAQDYDVEGEHNRIQEGTPLRSSLKDLIKVYTEDKTSLATLTDSRF